MSFMRKGRLHSIQGLKGIAALMVYFSHALCMSISPLNHLNDTPLHIFYDGQIAVVIFIVISGFFYYKKDLKPSLLTYMGG